MSTAADLRRIALSLACTIEAPHFDRAAFKVARIYVTLAADRRTANFKFTLVPRTRKSHASCCESGCELRVQTGH
jgi:hypothetical protein